MQLKVIQWDFEAWEEYLDWQTQDKKMLKRINQLIKTLLKHQKGGCRFMILQSIKRQPPS